MFLDVIRATIANNGYEVIANEIDNGEGLEIEFETGTTENWNIYKREIL